jgi:hypothetical protein
VRPSTQPVEKPVVLIIAVISGFTRFMWRHRETLAHAQVMINELIGALLEEIELPLEVAKLEGDAVFLYMERSAEPADAAAEGELIGLKLVRFFDAFWDKLVELHTSSLCECDACANLDRLRLKIILHTGTAVFYTLGRFSELSGPDVITVHRLAKNSVTANQYVLATEEAYTALGLAERFTWSPRMEDSADIGSRTVWVHYPGGEQDLAACPKRGWWQRFGHEWVKYAKSLPYRLGLKRTRR